MGLPSTFRSSRSKKQWKKITGIDKTKNCADLFFVLECSNIELLCSFAERFPVFACKQNELCWSHMVSASAPLLLVCFFVTGSVFFDTSLYYLECHVMFFEAQHYVAWHFECVSLTCFFLWIHVFYFMTTCFRFYKYSVWHVFFDHCVVYVVAAQYKIIYPSYLCYVPRALA